MPEIASGTHLIDVHFRGFQGAIAACLLEGGGELAVVDCGPTSCLPKLREGLAERGLGVGDLTALLLTHIHFDHAGAAGSLVRENPRLRVYVHSMGAPHMADPAKLLNSATRLYGDAMQQMFGEFLAVPRENLISLEGGEGFRVAGRDLEVAYTPGHASHHVSYFDQSTGIAFTGDTTGMRLSGHSFVAPVMPPPDINLAIWDASLDEIARRKPSGLFVTHFGPFYDVEGHIERTREGNHRWAERAKNILAKQSDESAQIAEFNAAAEKEFHGELPALAAGRYTIGSNPTLSWYGLARYWRKHAEAESSLKPQ
ncbi:MAG TPA: MBL fold metallo-hydrolase [Candidatus Acidoferrum sp.]|nr:MBL fold metallo-hydrolase [Candidatus Acidoferrum sp.]